MERSQTGKVKWWRIFLLAEGIHFVLNGAAAMEMPKISFEDKVKIKEAFHLVKSAGDTVWDGWSELTIPIVFVEENYEYLIGHPQPSDEYQFIENDPILGSSIYVKTRTTKQGIAAAYPVCGIPSVLISSPRILEKSSPSWVVTLIHEMFHVYQQNKGQYEKVKKLKLGSETDASWMLNFPFPYSDQSARALACQMGYALYRCLNAKDDLEFEMKSHLDIRLAFQELLQAKFDTENYYKYAKFQEWIEGVARYTERAVLRNAVKMSYTPIPEFQKLKDYVPYEKLWTKYKSDPKGRLKRNCESISKNFNRVNFYWLGAAQADLLDLIYKDWKKEYFKMDVWLDDLVKNGYEKLISLTKKSAPMFELKSVSGELFRLKDYMGKPILLFFLSAADWATPAHKMYPAINSIAQDYKYKGLEVFGILLMSKKGEIEDFMKKKSPSFPLLLGMGESAYSIHTDIIPYRINLVPGIVLIRQDGSIAFHNVGFLEKEKLVEKLKEIF